MQPLKITVPGKFWDSLVYAGRLYLFTLDGRLLTLNWDNLIEGFGIPQRLRLAFTCAFARSDYLYVPHWNLLFGDPELRKMLKGKYETLSGKPFVLTQNRYSKYVLKEQDSPFPFPHTDAVVFKRTMFVASHEGVHEADCAKKKGNPVSSRSRRIWDCPVLSINAAYSTLSLAAGDQGLFETSAVNSDYFPAFESTHEPKPVVSKNCIESHWTYFSLYGSSHLGDGFLAHYSNDSYQNHEDPVLRERRLRHLYLAGEVFGEIGYSWGNRDKLCLSRNGHLHIVRYNPWAKDEKWFEDMGIVRLKGDSGQVVSGGVAAYGVVFEANDSLSVITSDTEKRFDLKGEPVRWRIFPRSKHYENHLHVIYEDRLDIYSFNHDYFVDQKQKRCGSVTRVTKV